MVVKAKVSETYCVQLFPTPWTTQSMELSRPEYWSGQPFSFPGDLPNRGTERVCERESLSRVRLFVTPWTRQSMGFSRPEYWSGQPFPSPGDLPNPEIEPKSPALQADSLPAEPPGKPKNTGVGSLSLLQGIFPT